MTTVMPPRGDRDTFARVTEVDTVADVGDGRRAAVLLWVRSDVRRRWRALVVLGILAGVTGGLAMAALAGARRTDTSLERLRVETNAADAVVFATQVGAVGTDWSLLRDRPEVADLAVWDLLFGVSDDLPGGEEFAVLFASDDGAWGDTMTRPVVTEGRLWDPAAPDEVVVVSGGGPSLPVGATFSVQTYGPDQVEAFGTPTGPTVTFRVVGAGKTVNGFLFTGGIMVGPGFAAKYGDSVFLADNAEVRLRHGSTDTDVLQRSVNEVVASGTPVFDLNASSRRVDTAIEVERSALLLLAAAVALAGGLLVAQALARSASAIGGDALALRALGMSRREMIVATVYSHVPAAVPAAIVAAVGAVAASRFFPVGVGRKIDPGVGFHADAVVVVPGTLLVVALVLVGGALAGRRAATEERRSLLRPSWVAARIRTNAPVPVGVGASMALEAGTGRSKVAVRPALIGVAIGVTGLVGTLTIEHSVSEALAHPERAGVTWDATVDPLPTDYGPDGLTPSILARMAAAAPSGTGISEAARQVLQVDGVGVPTFMTVPYGQADAPAFTVITGRDPTRPDEAAIGPKTASDVGVGLGDTVRVGDAQTPVTIVGIALFPPDVHAEFDEGLWLHHDVFDEVAPPAAEDSYEGPARLILLEFPPGTDVADAITATETALGDEVGGVYEPELPVELTNLSNVRTLPWVLAVFLALLAVAAVSHVMMSTSRRRRHEFAVLRALGVTRRSTGNVVRAQATVIAVVGLLAGIPLGVVIGRIGWRLIAERVPLQNVAPVPALAVALVVPAALIVMNLLAMAPARSVRRLRPAETLREE